jgi:hypothetical protein
VSDIKSVPPNMPPGHACTRCGNLVHCTCLVKNRHAEDCRYAVAARCPVELACEHGFQACPICDACTCGHGAAEGIR